MLQSKSTSFPNLGFGLGLRSEHYDYILKHHPQVDWFEILTENYLVPGGRPLYYLDQINERYPMVMHGVSLSIGSCDPINWDYVKAVRGLAERINAKWISDHLCWTGVNGYNMHDLLPLPYTEEALAHVVDRVKQVQDYLGTQILLENASSYITYQQPQMTEWEFLREVANQADCFILLDINNVYVNSYNHGFDPCEFLTGIPQNRVQQFHLAGHSNLEDVIIDTHDNDIIDEVWALYETAIKKFPDTSVMIERDDNIPFFPELYKELQQAKQIAKLVSKETVAL